ncbi:MAG TPA: hypothetical protein VF754_01525, partial [Pyrinomonadaceae bacterium]
MRIRTSITLFLLLSYASALQAQEPSARQAMQHKLMPVPASVQFQTGRMPVAKSFQIAARGHVDGRLRGALARFARRLEGRTGLEFRRELATDAAGAALVVE